MPTVPHCRPPTVPERVQPTREGVRKVRHRKQPARLRQTVAPSAEKPRIKLQRKRVFPRMGVCLTPPASALRGPSCCTFAALAAEPKHRPRRARAVPHVPLSCVTPARRFCRGSVEARFGPDIPDPGLDGLLYQADPLNGCTPLKNPVNDTTMANRSIVYMRRDDCKFVEKVQPHPAPQFLAVECHPHHFRLLPAAGCPVGRVSVLRTCFCTPVHAPNSGSYARRLFVGAQARGTRASLKRTQCKQSLSRWLQHRRSPPPPPSRPHFVIPLLPQGVERAACWLLRCHHL